MSELDLHGLGIGTWQNEAPEQCAESVATALDVGYRHVDTAQAYENEAAVGRGIADSTVPREEVFLATKVHWENLAYDDVLASVEQSLERLGTDYLDLLYVHWPIDAYDPEETLTAFEELYDAGTIRHIGLSNFEPRNLDAARDVLDAPVFAHQFELHPFLQQDELREYAAEHDHHVVAYSPLARGKALDDSTLADIAEKHDATPAAVSLAWLESLDNVATIPKATGENHIRDNWSSYGVALDESDVERIAGLDAGDRTVDFDPAPWNQ